MVGAAMVAASTATLVILVIILFPLKFASRPYPGWSGI